MRFRSFADLSALLVRDSDRFRGFDLIVGIPRSGLLAATLLSLLIHKPVVDLAGYAGARRAWGGRRLAAPAGRPRRVLVLDDSVNTGAAMAEARERLAGRDDVVTYACVFVVPGGERLVDMYCEIVPHPRVFEWNVFHHGYGRHFCFDMDGVLCADPSDAENDDGNAYMEFLANARPWRIPAVEIGCIVTCRLEKYRLATGDWLSRHGIRFRELVMMPCSSAAERKAYGHARFKAEVYAGRRDAMLFIESCDSQAREIHRLTGRPVLAVSGMRLHGPEPHEEVTQDRQREEMPGRAFAIKESGCAEGTRAAVAQRFLILARDAGERVENLRKVLEPLGRVEVVVDRVVREKEGAGTGCPIHGLDQDDPATVWIPDEEAEGYGGLMGREELPRITAWSRAMVHLERTLRDGEVVWFVEDDVAGDADSFERLVAAMSALDVDLAALEVMTRDEDGGWHWWGLADGWFERPCRAFQPLCRLSARLLRKVLEFREKHGGFLFHELLFASVARREGMSMFDWRTEPWLASLFREFRYRPEVVPLEYGISHPVKEPRTHAGACAGRRVPEQWLSRYHGVDGAAWYATDYGRWKRAFSAGEPVRVLETGSGTGAGANLFLDYLFTHPDSEVHAVDLYDGDAGEEMRTRFEANAGAGGHAARIHLYEGTTREVLAWMIAGDGYWESFDFIHLAGANDAADLLADACQAWALLKPGGMLVMEADGAARPALDAFRLTHGSHTRVMMSGKSEAMMKLK